MFFITSIIQSVCRTVVQRLRFRRALAEQKERERNARILAEQRAVKEAELREQERIEEVLSCVCIAFDRL